VSIDMPSGRCSDSGRVLHAQHPLYPFDCIFPDLTVTFHRPRVGHFLKADFADHMLLAVKDIGLGMDARGSAERVRLSSGEQIRRLRKGAGAHKYSHGHALVLSGGVGKGGAARLAARGALRIGAGLVTVGCPPAALQENASALDAVMLRAFGEAEAL